MSEIEILDVKDTGYSIAVEYRFDFGYEGRMNFNLNTTEEQIISTLRRKYKRMKRTKEKSSKLTREALKVSLKGKKIKVKS